MNVILFAFAVLFGLTIGSFLNVLILRKSMRKSLYGRSRCSGCKKTLSAFELIPVVSFLVQKGRCRSCGIAIFWQYPFVEILTAVLFAAFLFIFPPNFSLYSFFILILAAIGISAGIVILVSDLRFTIIPDYATLILFVIGAYVSFSRNGFNFSPLIFQDPLFLDWFIGFSLALFFFALWFFSKGRWMGLGDAKLVIGTSLILGAPASLVAFLFSFWLGAVASVVLMIVFGKNLQSKLPFGPFILAATVLAYFFTDYFLTFHTLFIL